MEEAIKKAIEGGWKPSAKLNGILKAKEDMGQPIKLISFLYHELVLLDPLFWQCLGKAEGWKKYVWSSYPTFHTLEHKHFTDLEELVHEELEEVSSWKYAARQETWLYHQHRFIDYLAESKPIDDYFNELLHD